MLVPDAGAIDRLSRGVLTLGMAALVLMSRFEGYEANS